MVGGGRERLGGGAHEHVPARVRGGEQDRVGGHRGVIERRRQFRLHVQEVLGVADHRRLQPGGLDQRHRDGRLFLLQFQPQRVRETLDGVLGGRIGTLQRHGAVGRLAAHVDDRPAMLAQVRGGGQRAVHHAPVVGVEQAALVFQRHVVMAAEDGHAGIVDPGVEAAEPRDGRLRQLGHVVLVAHVGLDGNDLGPVFAQLLGQFVQHVLAARRQHEPGAGGSRLARGDQAHAAGGTRQHDDLRANWFQGSHFRVVLCARFGWDAARGHPGCCGRTVDADDTVACLPCRVRKSRSRLAAATRRCAAQHRGSGITTTGKRRRVGRLPLSQAACAA
ncbi:hypothetical protein D3C86_1340310 [compost metagenome]